MSSLSTAAGLSLLAALVWMALSTPQLTRQGLYYDEVHQAASAFAYVGQTPSQFAVLVSGDYPILNMSYSGALKTALYGLEMRLLDRPFSVKSWRLLGIVCVALGLLGFGLLTRRALTWKSALIFYAFFLTDMTLLLTSRHDWGPTALALSFRLLLIGVYLRGEAQAQPGAWNTFWLGALVGISTFEKLNNSLLLLPAAAMLLANPQRRTWRHCGALIAGGLLGGLPLLYANGYSLFTAGRLVSLEFTANAAALTPAGWLGYAYDYLSLGAGTAVREFILGQAQAWLSPLECSLLSATGLGALFVIVRGGRSSKALRSAGVLLIGYLALAVGLRLLPLNTGVHHWVMGSPFQYAALALAAGEILSQPRAQAGQLTRRLTGVGLGVFLLFRLTSLTLTEVSLARGDSSIVWDPSLTTAAHFAAEHRADSLFISANWGTANQILCFANGDRDTVVQPRWNLDNLEGLRSLFTESDRDTVYIYFHLSSTGTLSAKHQAVLDELLQSLHGEWQPQPLDRELQGLKAVRAFQLVRIAAHK